MGQRTQILVIRENNKGKQKSRFYHHQWGFGRNMYHAVMDVYLNDYNKETFEKGYDFLNQPTFTTFGKKLSDITPMTMDEVEKELAKHDYTEEFKNDIRQQIKEQGHYNDYKLQLFFDTYPAFTEVLAKVDINDFETIKEVFKFGDNNNGGLVIHIKENATPYRDSKFRIGFLLGGEDETATEKEFARWLTPAEYGQMNGGSEYSDKEFIEMFNKFCEYYSIDFIGQE